MRLTRFGSAALLTALVVGLLAWPAMAQTPGRGAQPSSGMKAESREAGKQKPIDINTASESELDSLPGIGKAYAAAIIKGRPYVSKDDLRRKKIIPEKTYEAIKDRIVAHRR